MTAQAVAVFAQGQHREAAAWAHRFNLPLVDVVTPEYAWYLCFSDTQIELRQFGDEISPIVVDFVGGVQGYRRAHAQGGGVRQPLARAVGIKGAVRPRIIDVTAGLGRDAFVLAQLGCTMTLIERSPIVSALLADGLARARADINTALIASRMTLFAGTDAVRFLQDLSAQDFPDVIYLDPMYPHREKTALVKKEMRALRAIVGDDDDAPQVLACALKIARARVVIKRPKGAPTIEGVAPSMHIASENTRFDVYLMRRNQ